MKRRSFIQTIGAAFAACFGIRKAPKEFKPWDIGTQVITPPVASPGACQIFPVKLMRDGGSPGGDDSDCSFTYTARTYSAPGPTIIDKLGQDLLHNATPKRHGILQHKLRYKRTEYQAGTIGLAQFIDGEFVLIEAVDEIPIIQNI